MDFITVVTVDDTTNEANAKSHLAKKSKTQLQESRDPSFITVLSINENISHQNYNKNGIEETFEEIESVLVYRLPGERLGFGLKFQGGIKSNEKIQRLFIQSCAQDSPASRTQASWGNLREGDEIISIDSQPVNEMTRMECVQCLKESNVAIKLEIRNGKGVKIENFKNNKQKILQNPPSLPPVPPRKKLPRRSNQIQDNKKNLIHEEKSFTPPPDAEYYINLFENETNLIGESESDDTGSSISTVIDKFSNSPTYSSESELSSYNTNNNGTTNFNMINNNGNGGPNSPSFNNNNNNTIISKADLVKVLQPFTMLEEEFNVNSSERFEECFKNLNYCSDDENINIKQKINKSYENIDIKKPPTPKPRQLTGKCIQEIKKRQIIPIPRKIKEQTDVNIIENGIKKQNINGKSLIPTSIISHNNSIKKIKPTTIVSIDEKSIDLKLDNQNLSSDKEKETENKINQSRIPIMKSENDIIIKSNKLNPLQVLIKKQKSESELNLKKTQDKIELIKSPTTLANLIKTKLNINNLISIQTESKLLLKSKTDINKKGSECIINENIESYDDNTIKMVSKISVTDENGNEEKNLPRLIDFVRKTTKSPINSQNETENCLYNENKDNLNLNKILIENCENLNNKCNEQYPESSSTEDDGDDEVEEGEKLGPPEVINGPGPSEAYFNFNWHTNMLPTIGEVEEEFSSLENTPGCLNLSSNENKNSNQNELDKQSLPNNCMTHQAIVSEIINQPNKGITNDIKNENTSNKMSYVQDGIDIQNEDKIVKIESLTSSNNNAKVKENNMEISSILVNNFKNIENENCEKFIDNNLKKTKTTHVEELIEKSKKINTIDVNSDDNIIDLCSDNSKNIENFDPHKPKVTSTITKKTFIKLATDSNEYLSHTFKYYDILRNTAAMLKAERELSANSSKSIEKSNNEYIKRRTEINLKKDIVNKATNNLNESGNQTENNENISSGRRLENIKDNEITSIEPLAIERIILGNESQQIKLLNNENDNNQDILQKDNVLIQENTQQIIDKDSIKKMENIAQIISGPVIIRDYLTPPTYSRLPPDGHEFPPNFSEPAFNSINKLDFINQSSTHKIENKTINKMLIDNNQEDGRPPLPKSGPPKAIRKKTYRQDLLIKIEDKRTEFDDKFNKFEKQHNLSKINIDNRQNNISEPSLDINIKPNEKLTRNIFNWRKDEKSEKSVRDKIAMFSNEDHTDSSKPRKYFNKSTENLLDTGIKATPVVSLTKKAVSVENLSDVKKIFIRSSSNLSDKISDDSKQVNQLKNNNSSLLRSDLLSLSRATSFSSPSYNYDDRARKASITNLLESRRRSITKLRGLVIPERSTIPLEPIVDLPEIKSKESEKVQLNGINRTSKDITVPPFRTVSQNITETHIKPSYKSIFVANNKFNNPFRKTEVITTPPAKPPRTSLILTKVNNIEESDSDSVLSSKISTPPMSPRNAVIPEKFALTRTLSSETNTSIASSTTSTLTSSSGSQASCSSVGSTPTVDMSRRIHKSGSCDSTVNRKNILASAKCRSGRDDTSTLFRGRRYEDEDSTDGCDEEEIRRTPKSKQRSSLIGIGNVGPDTPINYKLVSSEESMLDKVINVAAYIEVTTDTDDSSRKSDTSPAKVSAMFIDEERKASFKADPKQKAITEKNSTKINNSYYTNNIKKSRNDENTTNDLTKWARIEAAKARIELLPFTSNIQQKDSKINTIIEKVEFLSTPKSLDITRPQVKIRTSTSELREKFEMRSQAQNSNNNCHINKIYKDKVSHHERFSSLDSMTSSSSSGVSSSTQNIQLSNQDTPTEFGSFSSLGSNQSLITSQDIQLIIEEADPPLKNPEAFIVVLQRETPESSIGITLAGGSDYETKEITIHKILSNTPASKDGRLKKGDRILAVNGLSMRGLTHRESISVLKTPRPEVVVVATRSESIVSKPLSKKRSSLGSLTSLNDKIVENEIGKKKDYHKASRSLDMNLDIAVNGVNCKDQKEESQPNNRLNSAIERPISPVEINTLINSNRELWNESTKTNSTEILDRDRNSKKIFSIENKTDGIPEENLFIGAKTIEIYKDSCGLGFSIEGGFDSPAGNTPLLVKKVFMGGAAQKAGNIKSGDEILSINGTSTKKMTRVDAWNFMKQLPSGSVKIVLA